MTLTGDKTEHHVSSKPFVIMRDKFIIWYPHGLDGSVIAYKFHDYGLTNVETHFDFHFRQFATI